MIVSSPTAFALIRIRTLIAAVLLPVFFSTVQAQDPGQSCPAFLSGKEIEVQVPCFFEKGYHLSVGHRSGDFRFRVEVQSSGDFDFGQFGVENRNSGFERKLTTLSGGVMADYFLWKGAFLSASLESRNWTIQERQSGQKKDSRTFDFGFGAGYFWQPFSHLFFQAAASANFRKSQKESFLYSEHRISTVDILPMLRVGYKF